MPGALWASAKKDFLALHQSKISADMGRYDGVTFRGYLPIQDGYSRPQLFNQNEPRFCDLKAFLFEQSNRVKFYAEAWVESEVRPFRYLASREPMERAARNLVERDRIKEGLVCIFSVLEPCRTFSIPF